jgi:hypothetical protein
VAQSGKSFVMPYITVPPPRNVAETCIRSCTVMLLLLTAQLAQAAPEYIQSELTAPGSVDEALESSEYAFRLPIPVRVFSQLGEVFREGALDLQLRNYYFHRARDDNSNMETWAQGGALGYVTTSWKNRLRLGATLYGSQKLYGPKDRDGARLLKPGQQSFGVLGEAYLEARLYRDLTLKAYRQKLQLPYLNGDDTRMVPNTFEALTLYDFSGEHFVYGIAQTWRIKQRDASNFDSMTGAAGIEGPDRAVSTAAARYTFSNGTNIGLINHYGRDFINIFYTEFNSRVRPVMGLGLQLSAQFTSQNSVGDELGGDFDARSWGIKTATSYDSVMLSLAYTSTSNDTGIQSYWGGKPGYLSLMIKDFDRAGEDAWLVGMSSDFSIFGKNPFSGFINYARGDTPDHGRNASPDQSEFDITLDYKPASGILTGLWFRLRGAFVGQEGSHGEDLMDIRFIVNYDFPIM